MPTCKYKEGDLVRIKSWDNMLEEFGYDDVIGGINTATCFLDCFKPLCGKTVKIYYVNPVNSTYWLDITPANLSAEDMIEFTPMEIKHGFYKFSDDDIESLAEYRTNRDFYNSLDEFERTVYIVNFVRNYSNPLVDIYSRLGQDKVKKAFQTHLDLPYISEDLVSSIINNA